MFSPEFRTRVVGALFIVIPKMLGRTWLDDVEREFLTAASRAPVHIAETILPKVMAYPGVPEKLLSENGQDIDDAILAAVEAVLLDFKDLKLE